MSKQDNLTDFLTDVADAIREKKGTTEAINAQNFSDEIRSIEGGGGIVPCEFKDVNFYDYEGTILHSYTWDEFVAKNEMPPLPTHHEGLVCQEWNYTLEEVLEQGGRCDVGAIYIPSDGNTHLICSVTNGLEVSIVCDCEEPVDVDWGDGDTDSHNSVGKTVFLHKYVNGGDYDISIGGSCSIFVNEKGFIRGAHLGERTQLKAYCFASSSYRNDIFITFPRDGRLHTQFCLGHTNIKHINIPKEYGKTQYVVNSFLNKLVFPNKNIPLFVLTYSSYIPELHIPKGYNTIAIDALSRQYLKRQTVAPNNQNMKIVDGNIVSIDGKQLFSATCYSHIPDGVEVIVSNSMRYTNNRIINSPSSLINIGTYSMVGSYAFYNFFDCETIPTLTAANGISGSGNWRILVKKEMLDGWKTATNWSTYSARIVGVENPIIYYVDGVGNLADTNMSWQDMINAGLNYSNYSVVNGEVKSGSKFITYNGNRVLAEDTIIDKGNYIIL